MGEFRTLKPAVRAYVALVVTLGAVTLVHSIHRIYSAPLDQQWLILAGLTLLTGSFSVKLPSTNAYISVSEVFVFASVLLFGVEAGTVTVLLECLVILLWMRPRAGLLHRLMFNIAAPAVAIWVSGEAFYAVWNAPPYSKITTNPGLPQLFGPLFVFTTLYFLLNSWFVAIAVSLEKDRRPMSVWWKNFAWLSVNYFSGASVAALIVTFNRRIEVSTLVVIVPLLVISYLTFRTAIGRAEDSLAHVSELNRLYLSTIETLAMAIDAKDQITHGHIRRVQDYAVGLAKQVGVSDEKLIKAIEAAALLHDMGKLAVPEYILNKPGKLTPAEFEKMKLHASVGADILSAIDFPYPVVPIVRHHHENWDGTGYPTGLRGTEIPIGARILSVVDCFDALTSDRPYRPRLSDDEALQILNDRRATMYDPLVVDTFSRVFQDIAPDRSPTSLPSSVLNEITGSVHPNVLKTRTQLTPGVQMRVMTASERSAFETFATKLQRDIPFTHATIFAYDYELDEIESRWSSGTNSVNEVVRMSMGHGLSGWVAANKRTIMNSDPRLDLGDRLSNLGLRSCLSAPILSGEQLVGVLTVYSPLEKAFADTHQELIEQMVSRLVPLLRAQSTELVRLTSG